MLREDITPGHPPKEISFRGYTTKNLHHSTDATKAFENTIERFKKGLINDGSEIVKALKATDAYMKLNDIHIQQQRAANPEEISEWSKQHKIAKDALSKIGEFMHHQDYWNAHQEELQILQANAGLNNVTGEMYVSNSHNPFQDILYEASSPVASWKKEVKDIHGKDVKFEEEKKGDRYGVPMVHAYDKHGNKVGHIEKKSGYKFIFKTPFDEKLTESFLDVTEGEEKYEIEEKTLTPAELKKREEIAQAMEKKTPGMDKGKKMAIATAVAKRVAEELDEASLKQRVKTILRKVDPTLKGRLKDRADDAFDRGLDLDKNYDDDFMTGAPASAHLKHSAHLNRLAKGEKPFQDKRKNESSVEGVNSEDLLEMKQGKEYTQEQIKKKIQTGEWEAMTDIKPGKHVELRHHTGKRVQVQVKESEQIEELSTDLLARYKKAAGEDASKSDKEGNFKKADKRFSGIIKATKKQFSNETK